MTRLVGAGAAVTACLAVIWFSWRVIGPGHPVFVAVVVCLVFSTAALTGPLAERLVPPWWLARWGRADRILRALGVRGFGRFLELIRWRVRPPLDYSPDGVARLARDVIRSFGGHVFGVALHGGVAVVALGAGHGWSALWLVLTAIPLHLYPALLQVMVYRRVARLQQRMRAKPRRG